MDVTREFYPISGVNEAYVAFDVIDSESAYSAGTPVEVAPGQKYDWSMEQSSESLYYKGKPFDQIYGPQKNTIVVTFLGMSAARDAEMKGLYYNAETGRIYSTGDEEPPYSALGLNINKGKEDNVCIWFPKGKFTGGKVTGEIQKDNVTLTMIEYTFDVYVTSKKYLIDGKYKGVSYVKGDTSDSAFDATNFFSQVQTPDTASAPDAIAISSIVPADGATSVAANASIVITFNNKIAREAVMVINADTATEFGISKAWNAAGKVLTITHGSTFASGTNYIVAIAGVVDVYGQALAAVSKDFTTAS